MIEKNDFCNHIIEFACNQHNEMVHFIFLSKTHHFNKTHRDLDPIFPSACFFFSMKLSSQAITIYSKQVNQVQKRSITNQILRKRCKHVLRILPSFLYFQSFLFFPLLDITKKQGRSIINIIQW